MNMKPFLRSSTDGREIDGVDVHHGETGARMGSVNAERAFRSLKHGNLTLDTDLYELTMVAGYHAAGKQNQTACFDLYYRSNPDNGAFCIFAGLASVIDYVENLRLYPDDLEYLRTLGIFTDEMLERLRDGIRFTGDIRAVPEGTIVFPGEPLIRVIAPIPEAQILETTLLALVGHQTLIATKAARISIAARGKPVVDFGTRRGHGVEAAVYGARSAYLAGCAGTSNVNAGKRFGVPVKGTHAHSWVESFDTEIEAFQSFADIYPDNCVLLVDTYDTAEGVRHAVSVGRDLRAAGKRLSGIRIDSGDLAYYSKVARSILDEAGFPEVQILASSDLDEWLIQSLEEQGAQVDVWCVGTRLMTSYQTPSLGVVYKLMAVEREDGTLAPKIKISQNPQKVTNPGVKKIIRFYNGNERMIGDLLAEPDEPLPAGEEVIAHHPMYEYMKKTYRPPYTAKELLVPIFSQGRLVYDVPSLDASRSHAMQEIDRLEPEYKRFSYPHIYKVSLSSRLYAIKSGLLQFHRNHR